MAISALIKLCLSFFCGGICIYQISSECILPKKGNDLKWTKLREVGIWYSRNGTNDILSLGNVCSSFEATEYVGLINYTIQSMELTFPSFYDIPTNLTRISKGIYSMVALPPYGFIFTGHIGDELLYLTDSKTYFVTITCLEGLPSINVFTSGNLRNIAAEEKAFKEIDKVCFGNIELYSSKCNIFI